MCGYLLPPEGDPCPTVVPTPFGTLGDDIGANATCSAFYANPRHQKHISRPLEGQGFEVLSLMHSAPILQSFEVLQGIIFPVK